MRSAHVSRRLANNGKEIGDPSFVPSRTGSRVLRDDHLTLVRFPGYFAQPQRGWATL